MAGLFVDWTELTGQSQFVIDIVTLPLFSAFAGLITNWTGVWMLFAPVEFKGFHVPGLAYVYPYLPRRVQILPIFAPGGRFGFCGFIPARTEKMASLTVDKAIARIGGPRDFYLQLQPAAMAARFATIIGADIRATVDAVMVDHYSSQWLDLPPQIREPIYAKVAERIPDIAARAFDEIGEHIDELLEVKTMVIEHLRARPALMKDIIYGFGTPELRFMVRSGLLGFPFGVVLALYLAIHHHVPILGQVPAAAIVLFSAAMIGVVVNVIAVRVVFTPAEPQSRWRCIWKQALFARRQDEAAKDFGHAIAHRIITMETVTNHLLSGQNGDKTRHIIEQVMVTEVDRILGWMGPMVRIAIGSRRLDAIRIGSAATALATIPALADDAEFNRTQADKLDTLCTQKLRDLPPRDFVDLLYSAIEQDAWLLYLHGAVLGIAVGASHLAIFGA